MTAWQPASEPGDVIDPGWLGTALALIALARAHGHPDPAEVAATALAVHRGTVITRGLPREIDAWIAEQTAARRAADESLATLRARFRDVEAGPGERRPVPDLPVDPVDVESWRRYELDRDAIWLARHIARLVEQAAHGHPAVTPDDVADLAHATVRRLRSPR